MNRFLKSDIEPIAFADEQFLWSEVRKNSTDLYCCIVSILTVLKFQIPAVVTLLINIL